MISRATIPLLLFAAISLAPAEETPDKPVQLTGKWILDSTGRAVGPDDFRRGLQASGLVAVGGTLWSVGDQRSQYPGHILQIDPASGHLASPPIKLVIPKPLVDENPHFAGYRRLPNADFEGITVDPTKPSRFFAVTEDKTPWIATVELEKASAGWVAKITDLCAVAASPAIKPWRDDSNFRLEGLTASADGKTLYLAYERASDDLPKILRVATDSLSKGRVVATDVNIDFKAVPRRADKSRARLNINGIQYTSYLGKPHLIAVARDQERILVIDLESRGVRRIIDLDLRSPDRRSMLWVSPEGLTIDETRDTLWIVNDPDSVRGNYRLRDSEAATGRFADYVPLLFEAKLSEILGPPAPRPTR